MDIKIPKSNNVKTIHAQKGAVLAMVAIGLLAILATAGMAIDMGHGYLNKTRLQNSLDAAALSGARTLHQTRDATQASDHARQSFTAHLSGEMSGLDATNVVIQYSVELNNFIDVGESTTSTANYIRVVFQNFATPFSFSQLLPGIGDNMQVAASAVAGGIPIGGSGSKICDIAPLLMCGDAGDTDCSDGTCYGVTVGAEIEYQLKSGSNSEGNMEACSLDGYDPEGDNSGTYHGYDSCVRSPAGGLGPGNFQALRMGGNGANILRDNLAGGYNECLTIDEQNPTVETEPGNVVGPTIQGFNTRFGEYLGPMQNTSNLYPPDLILTDRIPDSTGNGNGNGMGNGSPPDPAINYWYADYKLDLADAIENGPYYVNITNGNGNGNASTAEGAPYRRVIAIPVTPCDGTNNGQSTVPVLGYVCFFLTRKIIDQGGQDSYVYGQFIGDCEISGTAGSNPPSTGVDYSGPYKIVLYKDPLTPAS